MMTKHQSSYEDIHFIPLHTHRVSPVHLQGLLHATAHGHLYHTLRTGSPFIHII